MSLNSLQTVLYVEFIRTIVGFTLIFFEIRGMRSNLTNKTTLTLLGTVFFLNLIFLIRFLGIRFDQDLIRQFGSAGSGLIAALLLISWASLLIKLDSRDLNLSRTMIFVGISGFIFGRINKINYIEAISMTILSLTIAIIIYKIFRYVFNKNPYVLARQKIFVITLAWIIFIIFEGTAIYLLGQENYQLTALFLMIALLGRILITIGILLPNKIQELLLKIIN